MNALVMADSAKDGLAQNSIFAVCAATAVLTLAMLAFFVDLAQAPGRKTVTDAATSDAGSSAEPAASGRKRQWAGIGMALTWLGTAVLLLGIVLRTISVGRPPLGNMYEFDLAGTGFLLVCYLLWTLRKDVRWLGGFVALMATLFLLQALLVNYTAASQLMPSLRSYWLSIHVTVATLSLGLFTIGFLLTVLYLAQLSNEEKGKTGGILRSLPNSDTLDRLAYGVHIIAFPLWMFTILAGAIWAQEAWGHYWNWDPKEVWSLVIFIVYAAYLHGRVTIGWTGKKAATIVLIGFACILINYGVVNRFFVGQHSYSGL